MAPKRKSSSQHPTFAPTSGDSQSSQPSTSSLPQIHFTRVRTDQIHDDISYVQRDRSGGPNLQPPGVPSTSRSPSKSRDSKRRTSPGHRFMRDPGGDPHSNLSDPPNPSESTPTTPDLSPLGGWEPPLFHPRRSIDNPHSAPITYPIHDPDAILDAQRERPDGDRKKTVLSATKLLLQTASSALKTSPIPYVSQILDFLLTLLQVYETVDSNNESLKGLNDEVRKAYTAILRPLELYAGQTVPPELIAPLKEFHDALEEQTNRIEFLKRRGLFKRMVTASNIANDISDVKACINKAITSVSVRSLSLSSVGC
ncbi:uncharacterized protein EI90DRAFT_1619636 [Cantharellus anzutake]|uniref:uncharacterized protein n=1 Tax=Cantharellus anzutake TaxID=1750568 RepID=UPI001907AEB6|nr:uncharacterized protein EI90DRAFT_1619636 [Cantharellus anzutake]KAF8328246.1 hypothetical protein EI90DRAFT_1619636 [Cantharellus anzutake]